MSRTNFAILFSLKNIPRKRQFLKNSVSLVKLLFSYNPGNQAFSYHVYVFYSFDIMSTENGVLRMNTRSTNWSQPVAFFVIFSSIISLFMWFFKYSFVKYLYLWVFMTSMNTSFNFNMLISYIPDISNC